LSNSGQLNEKEDRGSQEAVRAQLPIACNAFQQEMPGTPEKVECIQEDGSIHLVICACLVKPGRCLKDFKSVASAIPPSTQI
jgi:hypothetical protein